MIKTRLFFFIITILLAIAIIVGVTIQIISDRPLLDSAFETLAFIVSGLSVIVALLTQISSFHERKNSAKIIHELHCIIDDLKADHSTEKSIRTKLDQLITIDHRIYNRIAAKAKKKSTK